MTAGKQHPPLSVWIGAVGLVTLAMLVVWFAPLDMLPGRRSFDHEALNLSRLESEEPGLHVVALGTSLTRAAMPFDQSFEATFRQRPGAAQLPVHFTRISVGSATFPDLRPAFDALQRHPPDILLMESNLLLVSRYRSQGKSWQALFHERLARLVSGDERVPAARINNRGRERPPGPAQCLPLRTPAALEDYGRRTLTWKAAPAAQYQPYLDQFKTLRRAGTRVVLLGMPRSVSAQRHIRPQLLADMAQLRTTLTQENDLAYWESPVIPEHGFCDQAHLNAVGSRLFTDWLQARLADVLQERGHG